MSEGLPPGGGECVPGIDCPPSDSYPPSDNDVSGGVPGGCVLVVEVYDLFQLQPIANNQVILDCNPSLRGITNASGYVRFYDLPEGYHTWAVYSSGDPTWNSAGHYFTWDSGLCGYVHRTYVEETKPLPPHENWHEPDPAVYLAPIERWRGSLPPDPDADPFITCVRIIEDDDGIPASGYITTDKSPTVTWSILDGRGPYVSHWVLRKDVGISGAVIASGITLDNTVTLPAQVKNGIYFLWIRIRDAEDDPSIWNVVRLNLIDRRRVEPVVISDPGVEDIVPLEVVPDDFVRYLPRWMSIYGTASKPGSGTLFYKFWQAHQLLWRDYALATRRMQDEYPLLRCPVGLPRLAWHLQTRFRPTDKVTATVRVSGVTWDIRRTASIYEFLYSDDPIFILDQDGQVLFRNLALREVRTGPVSGRYQIPAEPIGIVGDAPVIFSRSGSGNWFRLEAGSPAIDPRHAVIKLPDSITGEVTFKYQSETLVPMVEVSLSGQPYVAPSRLDLWNRFDEIALLAGISRRDHEDNRRFRERIHSRFMIRPGDDRRAVTQNISQDLTLVSLLSWSGRTTLDLEASGIYGVTHVDVDGLPEVDYIVGEELVPSGNHRHFTASKSDWLRGWVVLVDGAPVTRRKYPNLSVSGNVVDFGTASVSGRVLARYGYRNYSLVRSGKGFVRRVEPVLANVPSGQYRVVLSRAVRVNTLAEDNYRATFLVRPDGLPNARFLEVAEQILSDSPVHFSRAGWGHGSYWLSASESRPHVEHLPVPFDLVSD